VIFEIWLGWVLVLLSENFIEFFRGPKFTALEIILMTLV